MKFTSGLKFTMGSVCATLAMLLSACGGTPGPYDSHPADAEGTQIPAATASQQGTTRMAGTAVTGTRSITLEGADPNSFTLNSSSDFKGFNSSIWNDNRSWYECDCGSKPQRTPDKMPWNPAG